MPRSCSKEQGLRLSGHETRTELEGQLFGNDPGLRARLNGRLGYFKNTRTATTLEETVAEFWNRYREGLKDTALSSKVGKAYVELRIGEWFS
jgi:hypothetical protein